MVEVFITNVQEAEQSHFLIAQLQELFPDNEINFDLEDCDRILRVEAKTICAQKIITLLNSYGFHCEVLL